MRDDFAFIDAQAEGHWEQLQLSLEITEDFPVNVEVSMNNNDGATMVYFDDLLVTLTTGLVVQENHFYPYGQRNEGINWTRQYLHNYGRGYQGQTTRFDEETGYTAFELRMYDARFGRWLSTDPMSQHYSPYVGMGNNPVSSIDEDGGIDGPPDDYYLHSDGTMQVTKTEDDFNRYFYVDHENNNAVTYLATLDKRQNGLVDMWNYENGFQRYGTEDLVRTINSAGKGSYGNGDHWLTGPTAGALLASAYEWQGRQGSEGTTSLQFGNMSGSDGITPNSAHEGGHKNGRNIDVRYIHKENRWLPLNVNDQQFDRAMNIKLVKIYHK